MKKNDNVRVVVDGEIHEGFIISRSDVLVKVKIPFYYSLSEKHGKPVENNWLIVDEPINMVIIV